MLCMSGVRFRRQDRFDADKLPLLQRHRFTAFRAVPPVNMRRKWADIPAVERVRLRACAILRETDPETRALETALAWNRARLGRFAAVRERFRTYRQTA